MIRVQAPGGYYQNNNTFIECHQQIFTFLFLEWGSVVDIDGMYFKNLNTSRTLNTNTMIHMGYADGGVLRLKGMELENVHLGVTMPLYVENNLAELTLQDFVFKDSTVESYVEMIRVIGV